MTSPVHDVALLREATGRLLADVEKLDSTAASAPSLLPGWSRGHVLAHLARNADALLRALSGLPAYDSAEARAADIDRYAPRPPAEQLADLRHTAARLDGGFAAQGATDEDARWSRSVELRDGAREPARILPFHRLTEVELHHVDLGIGYGLDDLPGAFVERQLARLAGRFSGHPQLPESVELRAEDGTRLQTGAAGTEPLVVTGNPTALVGWLAGRTGGSGLSCSGPLPVLPPL